MSFDSRRDGRSIENHLRDLGNLLFVPDLHPTDKDPSVWTPELGRPGNTCRSTPVAMVALSKIILGISDAPTGRAEPNTAVFPGLRPPRRTCPGLLSVLPNGRLDAVNAQKMAERSFIRWSGQVCPWTLR